VQGIKELNEIQFRTVARGGGDCSGQHSFGGPGVGRGGGRGRGGEGGAWRRSGFHGHFFTNVAFMAAAAPTALLLATLVTLVAAPVALYFEGGGKHQIHFRRGNVGGQARAGIAKRPPLVAVHTSGARGVPDGGVIIEHCPGDFKIQFRQIWRFLAVGGRGR
jgi:hypothetical protein